MNCLAHQHRFAKGFQETENTKTVSKGCGTCSRTDVDIRGVKYMDRSTNPETRSNKPMNNMPPYYVLAYIMKL